MPIHRAPGKESITDTQATPEIRHPDVVVQLTDEDGNAYLLLGKVCKALRRAGYGHESQVFFDEATGGDYNHLLATCMRWVTVR